jgi:hypothetical protein
MEITLFQVVSYKNINLFLIYIFLIKKSNFINLFIIYSILKKKIFFDFDYFENLTTKFLKLFNNLNYNFNYFLRLRCKYTKINALFHLNLQKQKQTNKQNKI